MLSDGTRIDADPFYRQRLRILGLSKLARVVEAGQGRRAARGRRRDADGDGFLEYVAVGARRLANQGWKDSGDSIFFADGSLAEPPIALCEVQGYAFQAAVAGADLLEAFDRPGAPAWRRWAAALRERFRESFWVGEKGARFPAIALDGRKRPVDSATSNIGHLAATGIVDTEEAAAVAGRLAAADLDSGWGLRTASAASPRFNPLSYHGGSVWPDPHRGRGVTRATTLPAHPTGGTSTVRRSGS